MDSNTLFVILVLVVLYTAIVVFVTTIILEKKHYDKVLKMVENHYREKEEILRSSALEKIKLLTINGEIRAKVYTKLMLLLSDNRRDAFVRGIIRRMHAGVIPAYTDWRLLRELIDAVVGKVFGSDVPNELLLLWTDMQREADKELSSWEQ